MLIPTISDKRREIEAFAKRLQGEAYTDPGCKVAHS
jgi:hypothetical protein